MTKAILNSDVLSAFYGKTELPDKKSKSGIKTVVGKIPYAKKGEEVFIIADHDNVMIVENKSGDRFSVEKGKLIFK